MPKRRPKAFLVKLGARMRARRLFVDRKASYVAEHAEISVAQLHQYETGNGHPPAATLHRIAVVLGVSSSELMGENMTEERLDQHDTLTRIYADPMIGGVTRHMQDMNVEQRRAVLLVAAAIKTRAPAQTVQVMK